MIGLIKGTMRTKKALAGLPLPIASFRTNGNSTLTACTLSITPVQSGSGDPSPSNPRPISGWDSVKVSATGKNLFGNKPFSNWVSVGSYKALKNILPNNQSMIMSFSDNDNTVDVSGIYFGFLSSSWSGTGGTAPALSDYRWVISNGVIGANKTNTSVSGGNLLNSVFIYPNTEKAYNKLFARYYVQVELGSATTYEPYNGQTATIPLPHTVYGGELSSDGDGDETILGFNLKDISWTQNTYSQNIFNGTLPAKAKSQLTGYMAEEYKNTDSTSLINEDFSIAISSARTVVYVHDSRYNGVAEFIAGVNSKMAYELDTPTALTTSPVALNARNGQNNVWADAGDISELKFIEHHQYIGR